MGVLVFKKDLLQTLNPVIFGGGIVHDVTYNETEWGDIPYRFEPGTQPIAEAIGLGATVEYIRQVELGKIQEHERQLTEYALEHLKIISGLELVGPTDGPGGPIISFNLGNTHHGDIAMYLSKKNICVRSGHHCVYPLMHHLNLSGIVRISFGMYNTIEDVDTFTIELKNVYSVLKKYT